MDRRDALKRMGLGLAAIAMAGIAPKTHAAILKDRAKDKKRLVFYFTGTGNSLFVARQFSDNPLSIPQEIKKDAPAYEADEIGFVFPDYSAAAPQMVQEFVKKASFKASYFFTVVTFGADAVNVAEWWEEYARTNGLRMDYVNTLLMVDNFLPMFDMNEQMKMDKHTDENLAALLEDVGGRKKYIAPSEMGRFNKEMLAMMQERYKDMRCDTMFTVDADKCVQCMTCERVCPHKNFSLSDKGVTFSGKCESCYACAQNCPQKAITLRPMMEGFPGERNPEARYRHPEISLMDIVRSNRQ